MVKRKLYRSVLTLIPFICFQCLVIAQAQEEEDKWYFSTGPEIIFSTASISGEVLADPGLRFAPVFNLQSLFNYDPSRKVGYFFGMAIRNVGFVARIPNSNIKKKFRTYNIGIPFGVKLGHLDRTFFYGGYELEIPFHFKEKTFEENNKTEVKAEGFSRRNNEIFNTVFVGVQFPYGINLKVKYYLSNFFNDKFRIEEDGMEVMPYENVKVNIISFSLNLALFRNAGFYANGN